MANEQLTAPFPYFGGKRHIASTAWSLFGDVAAYVEPFAGSAAVLLGRPPVVGHRREIINDLDGWITNLWRAVRDRPDDVLRYSRGPVMELDNHARLAWLRANHDPEFVSWLAGDPEHSDPKAAAWWLTATIASIGGGTRQGPWTTDGERLVKAGDPRAGVTRAIPHLGQGSSGMRGIEKTMTRLTNRLQHVIITCGDWKRPLSKTLATSYPTVGVFFDPPYEGAARTSDGATLYANDSHTVSAEVREWCRANRHGWRIVLCGYDDEHNSLLDSGWRVVVPPKHQSPGLNKSGLNGRRDRLWVSPECIEIDNRQVFDFDALLNAHPPVSGSGTTPEQGSE